MSDFYYLCYIFKPHKFESKDTIELLIVLELAVAIIQAYVFTVLASLYSKETYAEINSILQE
jgi:F0F1-type ATP synthase membrane subunit a